LFKYLLDRGLITLGLYRLSGTTDNWTHPYVYTNPEPSTIVTAKDRIFVLGKEIPKDFIIEFGNKNSNEPSKNNMKNN
jgi:hypothetical protein